MRERVEVSFTLLTHWKLIRGRRPLSWSISKEDDQSFSLGVVLILEWVSISLSIYVVLYLAYSFKFQIGRNSDLYLAFYGSLWNCQREYPLVKLSQPLVTASWNDLKTCVTYWPNLGWCSTSLTKTGARTALLTSDFHYKPPVDPNVHSGWDKKDLMGQLHHLGGDVPAALESCE